jgi:hypothetical protein
MMCEQETILNALCEALAESRFSLVRVYFVELSDYHKVPLTFSYWGDYFNFGTWFMKNVLFKQKKIKFWCKCSFVKNKSEIM